jgi:hypothetical protein
MEDDMSTEHDTSAAERQPGHRAVAGDWLEVAGRPGKPPRRGQVIEVLGRAGHERYRVRWDSEHESVFFPTEAVHVVHGDRPASED